MIINLLRLHKTATRTVTALALCLLTAVTSHALDLAVYADTSALASGRWVRVSVPETGMYRIPAATLRRWGFSDLTKVRVHGYGGTRMPDVLSTANYVDDLPTAPQEAMADGSLVFFAQGPEGWVSTAGNRFVNRPNIYTTAGYYFIGETGAPLPEFVETGRITEVPGADYFFERRQHELDLVSPGEAGEFLVGEDMRGTPRRSFKFDLPGRLDNGTVWMETSAVVKCSGGSSEFSYTANGNAVPAIGADRVAATANNPHVHGTEAVARRELTFDGNSLDLGVTLTSNGLLSGAWLDYIAINYQRKLTLDGTDGWLLFNANSQSLRLSGVSEGTRIWDMTAVGTPRTVVSDRTQAGVARWTAHVVGWRRYVAWNPDARMPEPTYVETVKNQNMHAHTPVNMVIFSPPAWAVQSERIAEMHRAEGMSVRVVSPQDVYNEFSSGMADINGLRGYLKMLYDRGAGTPDSLQYALIMARATYDNRHLTVEMRDAPTTIPVYMNGSMRNSLNDEEGFGTDDFLAMLDDRAGGNRASDKLRIAVGRIPVRSATEASNYIDKLEQYLSRPRMKAWKNRWMIVADDEDGGTHLRQAEGMVAELENTPGQSYVTDKVYLDAYTESSGIYPGARQEMFRNLDEGVVWWTFVGHANNHSWTTDGQLTYNDINNLLIKSPPVLFAATCDFLRWDSNTLSGGEIFMHERYGGTIATISATRPVYIYENGLFVRSVGRYMGVRDSRGHHLRLGEIYRRAKNDLRDASGRPFASTNRLRFVLMGDPAMRLPIPDNRIVLDSIAGIPLDGENQPVIPARGRAVFAGHITTPEGMPMRDFNGHVNATIYDADESVVSNGNGDGSEEPFDKHGGRIFAGSAPVVNGRFDLKVVIPTEIAENYRNCTISMYALSNDARLDIDSTYISSVPVNGYHEAVGINRDFYIYGFDDNAANDSVPPVIESFYLNHESFANGDRVNTSPMAIARISDDLALNLSSAGIGHNMVLILDGNRLFDDVSQFYTPDSDGSAAGAINYPLENLRPGKHQLTLRIWDSNLNSALAEIDFEVAENVTPRILDIYSDANPASTRANFYLRHDRPEAMATVTVTVYNLMGRAIWSKTQRGVSDMFETTPLTWDLTDTAGRRVPRGIYLYRAVMECEDGTFDSGSRRIAVTD